MACTLLNSSSSSSSTSFPPPSSFFRGVAGCRPTPSMAMLAGGAGGDVGPTYKGAQAAARISLKNADRRLLLSHGDADVRMQLMVGAAARGRRAGVSSLGRKPSVVEVRASTTGEVTEVRELVKGLYYNVTLRVPSSSEVMEWYRTPGQYVTLLPTRMPDRDPAFFFVTSPVVERIEPGEAHLEFLISFVEGSVAEGIINSNNGDTMRIDTVSFSHGFDVQKLEGAKSIYMFASGYGIGPFRSFIETTQTSSNANQLKIAVLHPMYAPGQNPYEERFPAWLETGLTIEKNCSTIPNIIVKDPLKTVVMMVASVDQQTALTSFFRKQGVPTEQILTLFEGIPDSTEAEAAVAAATLKRTEEHKRHKFLPMGKLHSPVALSL